MVQTNKSIKINALCFDHTKYTSLVIELVLVRMLQKMAHNDKWRGCNYDILYFSSVSAWRTAIVQQYSIV